MSPGGLKGVFPWLITAGVFLAAVGGIFAANDSFYREHQENFSGLLPPAIAELRPQTVRIQIEFADGRKRAFRGPLQPGMSVLSALRASAFAGGFEVRTDERGSIVEIANVINSGHQRWMFQVNGQLANDLAGHVELQAGDKVVFRYQ